MMGPLPLKVLKLSNNRLQFLPRSLKAIQVPTLLFPFLSFAPFSSYVKCNLTAFSFLHTFHIFVHEILLFLIFSFHFFLIIHHQSLRELRLAHNRLRSISDLIVFSESLEILDLSYNELEELPNLGKLIHLREIYLSHNHLQRIEYVGNLLDLTSFELFFNELRAVPDGISR